MICMESFKMRSLSKIFATFFGIGYFPLAPGTLTSLIIVILYKTFLFKLNWPYYLLLLISIFFIGVYTSSKYCTELKKEDPRSIVIDEVLGQLIVMFRLPSNWIVLLAGFFLFRFFDILKPFFIKKTEKFPKGWGIMIDDIVAAAYAGIIINLYLLLK